MPNNDLITQFVDDLMEKTGIELPEEEMIIYKEKLAERVTKRLGVAGIAALSEESLKEYQELLDKNPTEKELIEFLPKHIENFEGFIGTVLRNFGMEFLDIILKEKRK